VTVYTLAILKGGSGKTTTSADLAAALVGMGRRVLAIDLDQQGNLTKRLGVTEDTELSAVAADVLVGEASALEAAVPSPSVPGVSVLVGSQDLASLDQRPEIITSLRDYLPELVDHWDDVVIDTPPALGLLTLSALAAADVVIAPVECATEAYDQLGKLNEFVAQRIAPRLRVGQRIHWIVPTKYHSRQLIDREVVELLTEQFPGRVTSPIRDAVAAKDAYTDGKPVSVYAPRSAIAEDYAQALAPIIGNPVPARRTAPPVPVTA
jgi:chromosome partitioning protein